ncbi:M42 family metallopeptidase [uncultured Cyclobacterium sp.]|uniref:M42 family metallopeptidase n=1 Tax=uncultured Cyclobacterium sp. TaxID=453820 RepID=UPI0030EEC383|tara:strand:- start:32549 stop:33601 length:1053 start_codon:yes stop_codon:yes gene_type:complete
MIDVALLKEICELPGAPGFEKKIRDFIVEKAGKLVDEISIDNIGNVTAIKRGVRNPDSKRVMVAAHMDEIGFIVTHIDDNGFIRFHTLGGFDPKTLTAQRVIIHGKEKDMMGVMGTKPIHVMTTEEKSKLPKITDYFIDLGMDKAEVEKWIQVGDPITRERDLVEMGNCVNCKSIDNRISVFILLEALRTLEAPAYDVYATFTVQEEVGIRGAQVSAHTIDPDFGIALDTTIAFDLPGAAAHEKITELGKGTAIKIMDSSAICDYRMVAFMKETATKNNIPFQTEILTAGGTDTAGVQRMGRRGAIAGAISIPTRHLHQVIEMANKSDVLASIQLLKASLEEIDRFDWSH